MFKLLTASLTLFFALSVNAGTTRPSPGAVKKYVDAAPQCVEITPHNIPNFTGGNFLNKCNYPVQVHFNQINTPSFGQTGEYGLHSRGDYVGGWQLPANQTKPYQATHEPKYGPAVYAFCVGGTATSAINTTETLFKTQKGEYSYTTGVDGNTLVNNEYKCWYSF